MVSGRWCSLLFYVTGETSLSQHILFHNTASCMEMIPPVLNSPASLIDYIASYKLSMVHKLCSAEHNTTQCRPAGTRMFRAPASSPSALAEICLVNCAMRSRGLQNWQGKIGEKKSFKHTISLWVSEWVCLSYNSTDVTFIHYQYKKHLSKMLVKLDKDNSVNLISWLPRSVQ